MIDNLQKEDLKITKTQSYFLHSAELVFVYICDEIYDISYNILRKIFKVLNKNKLIEIMYKIIDFILFLL